MDPSSAYDARAIHQVIQALDAARAAVTRAARDVDEAVASKAYRAWLGYYNGASKVTKWSKEVLVQQAARFSEDVLGLRADALPEMEKRTVGKMGLKGVPGFNIVSVPPEYDDDGGRQR